LANIQDDAPEQTSYPGHAERLREVWVAVRANLRAVLEQVTLADIAAGELPEPIRELTDHPDAWVTR
jgi:DNA-binding IscR family transcriptional regulator